MRIRLLMAFAGAAALALMLGGPASASTLGAAQPRADQATLAVPDPCNHGSSHPEIDRGDRGSAVRHAQCMLRTFWDYGIAADGIFGPKTEKAVRKHQRACGILVDGIVGKNTWKSLHPYSTSAECRD